MNDKEQKAYSNQKIFGLLLFGILASISSIIVVFTTPDLWALAIIIVIIGCTTLVLSAIEGLNRKITYSK